MLQLEEIAPAAHSNGHDTAFLGKRISAKEQMGYDRPSPKLLAFLQKHHGLCKHKAVLSRFLACLAAVFFVSAQNNNFVVFDAFWDDVFKL